MQDYGKVSAKFWLASGIKNMSKDGRMLSLYLLTCPHRTIAGAFSLPDDYVCADMGWTINRVRQGFQEISKYGFVRYCTTTMWVWIRYYLRWSPPENSNQYEAILKVVNQIPSECVGGCPKPRKFGFSAVFVFF